MTKAVCDLIFKNGVIYSIVGIKLLGNKKKCFLIKINKSETVMGNA